MEFKSMDDVRKHIKCGIPLPVYFVTGTDDYRKQNVVNRITEITVKGGSGFDTHRFSGKVSADEIADAAFEITFGGGRRCVIAEDIPFASMGESEYKKYEELVSEVSQMNGDTVLVFSFFTVDTGGKEKSGDQDKKKKNYITSLKKHIDKCGGGIITCNNATDSELATMMEREAAKYHCSLDRDIALYMISRCGNDSALLKNETKKTALYRGEGKITKADVDLMTSPTPDASVFELSDKISYHDETGAFRVLYEIKDRGESAAAVLSVITGFYLDLYRAKTAKLQGKGADDILSDYSRNYGKRAFVVTRAMNTQSKYSLDTISKYIEILLDADRKIKSTSTDDDLILDETVARLFAVK